MGSVIRYEESRINMLPKSYPIKGGHIELVRRRLGQSIQGFFGLIGINAQRGLKLRKPSAEGGYGDRPLSPTLAVFLRFIEKNIDDIYEVTTPPEASEIREIFRRYGHDLQDRDFGMLFGRDATAGFRWFTQGDPPSAEIQSFWLLIKLLEERRDDGSVVESVFTSADDEGRARGLAGHPYYDGWSQSDRRSGKRPESADLGETDDDEFRKIGISKAAQKMLNSAGYESLQDLRGMSRETLVRQIGMAPKQATRLMNILSRNKIANAAA